MNADDRNRSLAVFVLRTVLGLNLLIHGLVRLPKLGGFADGLVSGFADTWLPPALVRPFAYALPPLEAAVGALLLIGLFSRQALVAGGLLMGALVFGMALREQWSVVGTQMIYVIVYYLALRDLGHDRYSLDGLRARRADR